MSGYIHSACLVQSKQSPGHLACSAINMKAEQQRPPKTERCGFLLQPCKRRIFKKWSDIINSALKKIPSVASADLGYLIRCDQGSFTP